MMNTNPSRPARPARKMFSAQTLAMGVFLAFFVGLVLGLRLSGATESARVTDEQQPAVQDTADAPRYEVSVDDDPSLGAADAPIVLIEFSDYQCPYCKKWHDEVLPRLLETYGDQILYVYRDFPLSGLHPSASAAAEAANCAGAQDAYWQYHDALFSNQYGFSKDAFLSYARDLNLDMEAFTDCIENGTYQEEIAADYDAAAALGINSTPTFFINGLAVIGAQPYEVFAQIIDSELQGK